jgi:hypothetical protein
MGRPLLAFQSERDYSIYEKGIAMTIRIELSPETEALLAAEGRAQGLPLEKVAERLLKEALKENAAPDGRMSVAEFHRMLDAMAEGSERLPDLPTESFSRESFYEDRLDGGDPVPRR